MATETPRSPEIIRRFRRTFRPDAAKRTIFYGKAYDPHLRWADEMRHGVESEASISAKKLVNPNPKTLFQQKVIDQKERIYASHVRAPLGHTHDQTPGLPADLDPTTFTFGAPTPYDEGVGTMVNPKKTYAQVEEESAVGHDNYITSHKDYNIFEHVNRRYNSPLFSPQRRYGIPTYTDYTGKQARLTLKWPTETEKEKTTRIVNKRIDDFHEKHQPLVGHFHDPIKETMRVGPDHVFGIPLRTQNYGVNELLHDRLPRTYTEGRDQQRGLVMAMRQHLKDLSFYSFPELIHAFRFYDKEGTGKIDREDVREACLTFNLPVDVWLLEQVLDYCDEEGDGQIDYQQFARFLDWKQRLPIGFAYVPCELNYLRDKERQKNKGTSVDAYSARIQQEVDRSVHHQHTTNTLIHAAAGPTGLDTTNFRSCGVPTIRADLAPPRMRRVDDQQNYGDESTAYGLTNPSVYSHHGVYEKDLLIPRGQGELKDIFSRVGVQMTDEVFDSIYRRVSSEHPQGHVSVESFRAALDDLQASSIATGQHPLAV
ncbi:EF-hand domain-containing family member B-like [Babylonia areolata]|uniref:EF-hand domain-containing family member B-like n=1 Tax=Babylonia areolata TaxID=304850 RepID=UPI003FD102FC